MDSPGCQGASRSIGSIFCGNAHGNAPKAADLRNGLQSENVDSVQGKVMLYLAKDDPGMLSPTKMTPSTMVKLDISGQTVGSVLEKLSGRWSPIESKFFQLKFYNF